MQVGKKLTILFKPASFLALAFFNDNLSSFIEDLKRH